MRSLRRLSLALALVAAAALATAGAASAATGFVSPSHNIGCVISKSGARCDIRDHAWSAPPKPRSCELDWGGGVAVDRRGRAEFVCAGDTALGAGRVLAYGSSISRGRFLCRSRPAGVRCVNKRNGHGFFLSRQRYRLF